MIRIVAGFVVFASAIAVAAACSSSDGAAAPDPESCSTLAERCHGVDNALAAECHELGHGGDIAACSPRLGECLAVCPEKEGGTELPFGEGGTLLDAAVDAEAGPDPSCIDYCTCMKANCSSVQNYPFSDESVCYGACATYSAPERACFTSFCGQAVDAGARAHVCDHATGKLGTIECP